jgi:hypothetical protein
MTPVTLGWRPSVFRMIVSPFRDDSSSDGISWNHGVLVVTIRLLRVRVDAAIFGPDAHRHAASGLVVSRPVMKGNAVSPRAGIAARVLVETTFR